MPPLPWIVSMPATRASPTMRASFTHRCGAMPKMSSTAPRPLNGHDGEAEIVVDAGWLKAL